MTCDRWLRMNEPGRDTAARAAAAEVLRINPKFTIAYWGRVSPYKNPAAETRHRSTLLKAGLPEYCAAHSISAFGYEQTFTVGRLMSDVHPTTDLPGDARDVRCWVNIGHYMIGSGCLFVANIGHSAKTTGKLICTIESIGKLGCCFKVRSVFGEISTTRIRVWCRSGQSNPPTVGLLEILVGFVAP